MNVNPEIIRSVKELPSGKKIYFASDFHLGAPTKSESITREKKVIEWLEHISQDASAIFLLGDVFDFWFEYKTAVPKGYIRFLGKLAELRDKGIEIVVFAGNHDLWYSDYLPTELNIPIFRNTAILNVAGKKFFLGHGDGLAQGDLTYKVIKTVFTNRFCIWMFRWLHPDMGVKLAQFWSDKSRSSDKKEDAFKGDQEPLFKYCEKIDKSEFHDYYIFGHRHLPMQLNVSDRSTYFNLGEWISQCNYVVFDGNEATLKRFN